MEWTADSLGLLELSSIAAGIRAADEVVKAARVDLVEAIPISTGKFLVIFAGGVAEVEASIDAGRRAAQGAVVDERRDLDRRGGDRRRGHGREGGGGRASRDRTGTGNRRKGLFHAHR
jgi:hypothetical protein